MLKIVNTVRCLLLAVTVVFLSVLLYSFYTIPDEIYTLQDEDSGVHDIYTLTYDTADATGMRSFSTGSYKVKVSLFNMPIKDSVLTVGERKYVAISGDIIGLRLFTEGVLIVDIDTIQCDTGTFCPGESAGLCKGDIIYSIDGEKVLSSQSVNNKIKYSGGRSLEIEYIRNGKHYITSLTPVLSNYDSSYKGGLWIRDSAAGIGTVSFFDVKTGMFAALGHAVCDVDTGDILPLMGGDAVSAKIVGCNKGVSGKAGELCGMFEKNSVGVLLSNGETGVIGVFDEWDKNAELFPVASPSEVHKGKAEIVSTVDDEGKKYYDIEIQKITADASDNKNMVIKVTDDELIAKTGGIVQGMSGSPIIQDGKLVGVVTHVLVNDPTKGYGIFTENMTSPKESFAYTEESACAA
ncbi:MAG: SpoIVB peptidase [Clostridia bacterium]|nr:SpoIVB peptidase [Clostridia bacterium]